MQSQNKAIIYKPIKSLFYLLLINVFPKFKIEPEFWRRGHVALGELPERIWKRKEETV